MSDSTDFERFRELLEASSSRELTDSEVAFLGRMGFQSEECREWLETDAEAVDAWVSEDPLQEVPPPDLPRLGQGGCRPATCRCLAHSQTETNFCDALARQCSSRADLRGRGLLHPEGWIDCPDGAVRRRGRLRGFGLARRGRQFHSS